MDLNHSCTFQFAMWLGQGLLDLRLVSKVGCRAVCIPVCHTLLISINTQKSYLFVAVTVLSCQENWSFSMTVFMTLLIKKVFIQLRATRYHLWHSYLRLSNGSLQSECVWTRIPAALNSPTSRLQNKVLLNQLERQLFSGPSHTVCNKTRDLFTQSSSLLASLCNHRRDFIFVNSVFLQATPEHSAPCEITSQSTASRTLLSCSHWSLSRFIML